MSYGVIKDTIFKAIDEALSNVHTCTISKIVKVNAKTIDVKPVFNRVVSGESIELPVFLDVPLFTLSGGASYIHLPISVGDYCLLIFTERCSDSWYAGQDNVAPLEYRMHDYSDGFALVGVHNANTALTIPSVIQITGDSNQDGNKTHTGNYEITGNVIITGDLTVTGASTLSATVTSNGKDISDTHTHAGSPSAPTGPQTNTGVPV